MRLSRRIFCINLFWLGRQGSNLRMTGPKPVALPLGYFPIIVASPSRSFSVGWRRERDSNPRNPLRLSSFQDCPIQPLWHLSILTNFVTQLLTPFIQPLTEGLLQIIKK